MEDDDPFKDPEWLEFVGRVHKELIPILQDSAISVSLVPPEGEWDVKYAVELGLSIILDKPIIALAVNGRPVPPKLAKIADAIIEGEVDTAKGRQKVTEQIAVTMARLEEEGVIQK